MTSGRSTVLRVLPAAIALAMLVIGPPRCSSDASHRAEPFKQATSIDAQSTGAVTKR